MWASCGRGRGRAAAPAGGDAASTCRSVGRGADVAVFAVPRTLHGWRVRLGGPLSRGLLTSPGPVPEAAIHPGDAVVIGTSGTKTHRVRWSTPSQPSQQRWTRSAPWWTPSPESAFSQAPSSRSCPLFSPAPACTFLPGPRRERPLWSGGCARHHLPHPASHPGRPGRRRALHRAGLQRLCPGHGGPPRAHDRLWSGRGLGVYALTEVAPVAAVSAQDKAGLRRGRHPRRPLERRARVTVSADAGGQLLVEAPSMYDRYLHESATEGGPRRVATGDLGRIADGRGGDARPREGHGAAPGRKHLPRPVRALPARARGAPRRSGRCSFRRRRRAARRPHRA